MRERIRRFEEVSAIDALLLRQELGLGRYLKTSPRDPAKAAMLIRLALARIEQAERDDYVPLGPRRRRLKP